MQLVYCLLEGAVRTSAAVTADIQLSESVECDLLRCLLGCSCIRSRQETFATSRSACIKQQQSLSFTNLTFCVLYMLLLLHS